MFYEHKQQLWFRKSSLFLGIKHPKINRKSFCSERMSSIDWDVYCEAKRREMKPFTLYSVRMIKMKQFNIDEKTVKNNTVNDLVDMEHIAIKRNH